MSCERWVRRAAVTVTVAGVLVALFLLFRVVLGVLAPFLIAFLLATVTHPLAKRFAARVHAPEKVTSAAFTLLLLGLVGALLYLLINRAFFELQKLILQLGTEGSPLQSKLGDFFAYVERFFEDLPPQLSRFLSFLGNPREWLSEQLQRLAASLSDGVGGVVMRTVSALPAALLFLLVTVIACFYFSVEYSTICQSLLGVLPKGWQERLPRMALRARSAAVQYLRAYFLLFLITFLELWLGFLVLRVEYVFLLAFLVALLDFLPIFGVGTVLIPWGIYAFVTGNNALGIGLLVLYAIITVIRQVIEPHFVGKSLGLHPVLMLVALYAGIRLFGIAGFLIGPLLALFIKTALKSELYTENGANGQ
ncbi:MAG: sporulation integral membrane protein YtvI [Ruminococcaceae bacterium]|nr:sporulation integral membrane protein YtvI [Oscillospiraceae bacterium]